MPILDRAQVLMLHAAAVAAQLDRAAILSGLNAAYVQSLPTSSQRSAQLLIDLGELNATERLADGVLPLQVWIENAIALTGARAEAEVFQRTLDLVANRLDTVATLAKASRSGIPVSGQEAESNEIHLKLLVKTRLPRLLASCDVEPEPVVSRADAPIDIIDGHSRLDQWTYVCKWLSEVGTQGVICTVRIVDEVQTERFSEPLSRWGAEFVAVLLRILGNGGGDGKGDGGGGGKAQVIKSLAHFVAGEERRWSQLRYEVETLVRGNEVSSEALLHVVEVAAMWRQVARALNGDPGRARAASVVTRLVHDGDSRSNYFGDASPEVDEMGAAKAVSGVA
jgi:hypothetical protein